MAKAQVDVEESDVIRTRAEAERRFVSVSTRAAQDFRLGVESTRLLYAQEMRLVKDYFCECEQLAGVLIDREGQYSQTTGGLRFDKAKDVQSFNDQIKAISLVQKTNRLTRTSTTARLSHAGPGRRFLRINALAES